MSTIRLGLIADTHWPNRIPDLPYEAIENAFRDVDAILHAGDVESHAVLDHLSGIAPLQAVRGDDDLLELPEKRVMQFGGVRVGLIHGHRHPLVEQFFRVRRRLGQREAGTAHLLNSLQGRFSDDVPDVIVFGHLHQPIIMDYAGVTIINPGAVYALTLDSAQWQLVRERDVLRRRMLNQVIKRFQKQPHHPKPRSTVGILEISPDNRISTRIIDLPYVAHH